MEDEIIRNHNISQSDDIHNSSVDVGNHDTISNENRTNFSDELSEDSSTIESDQILKIPLQCNVCNKSFDQIEDLKYHLMGHIGITDYVSEDEIDESCDISNTNNNLNESIPNDNSRIIGDENRESTNKADYIKVEEDSSEIENGSYNKSIDYELDNFNNSRSSIKSEIINETKELKEQSDDYILKEEMIEIEEHPVKIENPIENDSEKLADNQIPLFVKGAKQIIQQSLKTILAKPIDKNSQQLSDLSNGDRECVAIDQNERNSVEQVVNLGTNITENNPRPNDESNQKKITPRTVDDKHIKQQNERIDTCIVREYLTKHLQNLAVKVQSHEEHSECSQKHSRKCLQNATSKVQANIKRPKRLSTSNQGYNCEICGEQFVDNNQLKKHLEKHTNKKTYFHCNFCHLKVLTIATLKRHLRKHIYKKQWYHCNICGKKCSTMGHLYSHLRGHSDERPYQCEVCDKKFRTKSNLKDHSKVHTRKPHSCEVCDKKYRTKLELKDHAKEHTSEKSHSCDSCGERFLRKTDLQLHRSIHYREQLYKNKLYKCETCRQGFSRELKLRKHIQFVHYMEKLYKCNSCDESFPTRRQLSSHLRLHIRDERSPEKTELKLHPNSIDSKTKIDKNDDNNEDTTSIDQEHLETHLQVEEQSSEPSTKNESYQCETCNKRFPQDRLLRKHIQFYHYIQKSYKCHRCNASFATIRQLYSHSRVHVERENGSKISKGEKTWPCYACGKKFLYYRLLWKHLQRHNPEKPTEHHSNSANDEKWKLCDRCGKFIRLSSLKYHLISHSGERPYQCTICGKKFAFRFDLKVHSTQHSKRRNDRRPNLCDKCGKQFPTPSHLREHLRVHTAKKTYSCLICGETFRNAQKLTRHIRVHTDERPHHCNVCHKRFKTRSCLYTHLIIHIGQKELYQSTVCGKNFSRKDNLRKHEMIHTGEKPF